MLYYGAISGRAAWVSIGMVLAAGALLGCSGSDAASGPSGGAGNANSAGTGATDATHGGASNAGTAQGGDAPSGGGQSGAGASVGGTGASTGGTGASTGGTGAVAAQSKGWLYTTGNQIFRANGDGTGTRWIGRGVNADDLYFCGYNYMLMTANAEALLNKEMDGLFSAWKPNFVRMSLGMDSYPVQSSWLTDSNYKTAMTHVIEAIGAHPNTYVLVTLRSDASMVGQDPGDKEPTGMPSDATNTPDKTKFPTGTDAVYIALVDSFAHDNFVLFGLTNEPGGNVATASTIRGAMDHAVSTIRAEEDRLGVPHHLVSVQGKGYSGDIGFYSQNPLSQDNVVYEVHGYPPATAAFTYDNIPVVIGEYGSLDSGAEDAFFQQLESKQISSLAWDFDPYSNCSPDLLEITRDANTLTPSDWGKVVQRYLVAHAAP
ncbi:MAG TPA: cellulase family glycosylhydrolase [Polyangiaceae bacterium]|nr:cellulase family glycosylhydrolase [Polyangiaceae bacterium]